MITILDLGINPKLLKHEIIGLLPSGSCSISRFSCYKDTKAQEILERFADVSEHDYYIICNAKVFKTLAKVPNAEKYIGYVLPNQYGKGKLVYVPNPTTIFANPTAIREKISASIDALLADIAGTYSPPGQGIIKSSHYPSTTAAIALALDKLLEMDRPLTIDIEAFSLKHYNCGIATISFAWDKHNGIAFPVDAKVDTYQITQGNNTVSVNKNELIETPSGKIMTIEDYYNDIYQDTKRNIN